MVQGTRLDCVIGSAGIIRAALTWALHHARHRQAFGRRLVDHPLMANVLADIALESEAAMLTALDLARVCERRGAGAARGNTHRHACREVLDLQARDRGHR